MEDGEWVFGNLWMPTGEPVEAPEPPPWFQGVIPGGGEENPLRPPVKVRKGKRRPTKRKRPERSQKASERPPRKVRLKPREKGGEPNGGEDRPKRKR